MDLSIFGLSDIVLSLKATYLANFFAMLIVFSAVSIMFVMPKYKLTKSFYALYFILTISMFLIVYAGDFLLFFVGWEAMSISTYFLLAQHASSKTLHKYIIFAMASALSLLSAIVILYSGTKSFLYVDAEANFLALSEVIRIVFMTLFLFGIFIKIGVIGFHYWLIDAYEEAHDIFAPYLSAILSKMGVYALIILVTKVSEPMFILAIVGVITSIVATFKAIQEDSLKRLLAYSSIAQVGYIVTVLGVADGLGGALYHSLVHTAVKLLLFINVAGVIYMTRRAKFSELGGLIYRMPQSFVLLLIGIITLAGMPPLGGFSSKFMIYTTLLDTKSLLVLCAVMFSSASAFLYVYKLVYGIYLGHPTTKRLESVKEVPIAFLIPQYFLAAVIVGLGVVPAIVVPYFNKILTEAGLKTFEFTNYATLHTYFSSFNGTVLMSAMAVIFVLVLILFTRTRSHAVNVEDRFDIAYCGEVPNEGTHLHYGFNIGQELKRVGFISTIIKNYTKSFYDYLAKQTLLFSDRIKRIYTGKLNINFNIAIIFVIILLWWSTK